MQYSLLVILYLHAKTSLVLVIDAWLGLQVNETLEEKVQPYIQNMNNAVLSQPIFLQQQTEDKKVSPSSLGFLKFSLLSKVLLLKKENEIRSIMDKVMLVSAY